MKRNILNILIGMALLLFASCSKILEEQPRSQMTPDFFKTTDGLNAGLTAAYDGLRYISGTEPTFYSTIYATDEFTAAGSGGSKDLDMTPVNGGTPINSATGSINVFWQYPFTFINNCNGIIQFGPQAGIADSIVAEAYFLRAYYYFNMVQQFGGVPLDLGSGNLKFNTNPTNTVPARSTQEDVYQAIIADLQYAEAHLPIKPRISTGGTVVRATAIHYLAKVYLTHGDNQLALTEAQKLLNPTSPYTKNSYGVALLSSYSSVIAPGNEHNAEVLFTCEHTETYAYNQTAQGFGSGPVNMDDRSCSYFVPNYQTFTLGNGTSAFLQRDLVNSRPWIRISPTSDLLNRVFADKTNDSRFNASFQTVWTNNSNFNSTTNTYSNPGVTPNGLLNQPVKLGDTAFVMLSYECSAAYRASKNYRIWTPSQLDRNTFPALKKFFDPNRQNINDASGRPFMLAKLSETYLIAAEAAVNLGQNALAVQYVNVLRTRAATPGNAANMTAATPATIDINYILDERSRELCGEQMRWFDLKRTGQWRARSTTYTVGSTTYTRDIKSYYDLRPIPQAQLDNMGNPTSFKTSYQNPGY